MNVTIRTLIRIWPAAAVLQLIGANKAPAKAPPKDVLAGSISGVEPTSDSSMERGQSRVRP